MTDQPEPRAIDEYSYPWAQTIDSSDGGRTIRIPWLDVDGIETGSVWVFRKDASVLGAMLSDAARTTADNPAASNNEAPDICELPHQTIGEEDDCHQRRGAGSDDGLHLALARIASERAHHEHCASLARTSEGGIAHSSIAAGLQIAEARLHAALNGPADTSTPAEAQSEDTCRPVQVDGETIRVHGSRPLAGLELGYAAEVVAAARRKFEAEPPTVPDDDGTQSALTRRIRARQRGNAGHPIPCETCTRARSRGFTVDALAHPGCADALATQETQ